jgi:two-component system response regulator HydG
VQPQPAFEGASAEFGLVGDSPQIQNVLRIIKKLHSDTSPVLITGESGVGKELVARAVHQVSPLARNVFLPVDSATLVGTLMESELFGHVRGAFTGALDNKQGLVRAADGGTLFLDEIGELTPEVQAKLLRLLQEQEIRPVGGTQPVKVNVRILAATNRNLEEARKQGLFRSDLYYRLKVISIRIPPLRERKSDILPLAKHFVSKHSLHEASLSDVVVARLLDYTWPGNVRELENTIRRMVALKSNPMLREKDLPTALRSPELQSEEEDEGAAFILPLAEVERRHILRAVEHAGGDLSWAASLLGIGKTTLYRKLKEYRSQGERRQGRLFG